MKKIESYKESRWVSLRRKVLYRDHFTDQYLKRYGKFKSAEMVHHIFPVEDFPEYQFCEWNLISLARSTHNMMHDRNTNELTDIGKELLLRTARQNKIEVPAWLAPKKEEKKIKYLERY